MTNKFHAINVANWVECDDHEYSDRIASITGISANMIAHFLNIETLPIDHFELHEYNSKEYGDFFIVKLAGANGELVSVIAHPIDNYSGDFYGTGADGIDRCFNIRDIRECNFVLFDVVGDEF